MDYESYRKSYIVDPQPEPRFKFAGLGGITLYFERYQEVVAYYTSVLGPPAYVEGQFTRSWPIAGDWLTLLKG